MQMTRTTPPRDQNILGYEKRPVPLVKEGNSKLISVKSVHVNRRRK